MTVEIYYFLLLQVTFVVALYVFFFRSKKIPSIIKLLIIVAYITIPIAILIKGIASAIYISDLIAPLLILYLLRRPQLFSKLLINRYFLTLSAFLIILPLFCGGILALSGKYTLDLRDWMENGIWFYRNFVYLLVFGIGLSLKIGKEQVKNFIEMNLGFGVLLGLFGLVNYLGSFNMAIFETISWGNVVPEWYQENSIGLGFMGLFRGSIGQWFSILVLLAIGSYHFVSPKFRKIACLTIIIGIVVILLSFSRIGFIGLIVGLAVLSLSRIKSKGRVGLFVALFVLILCIVFTGEIVRERFLPEIKQVQVINFGEAAVKRVLGWERSVKHFSDDFYSFLIGIGPANRESIYKITGIFGPHNEYLDIIYRTGIFGLMMLLWFLFIMLLRFLWIKGAVESFMKPVIWSLIAIVIANLVIALTQSHLLHDYATHTLGFYIYLLYGVFIGSHWNKPTKLLQRNQ